MRALPQWVTVTLLAVAVVAVLLVLAWATYRLRGPERPERLSVARRVHRAVGRPWLAATATTIVVTWVLAAVAATLLTPGWRSTAVVAFVPRDPYTMDAQTLTLLGPRYVALLESPRLLADAAEQAGMTVDDMREGVDGEMEPDTLVLRVSFAGGTAEASARGANALAAALADEAESDPLVRSRIIGKAVEPVDQSGPSLEQLLAVGWIAGLAVALVVGTRVRNRGR